MFPGSHFALGYDTFVRLLDVSYYQDSRERMDEVLSTLESVGTRFAVGGRYNKERGVFEQLDREALEARVPEPYRHMFTAVQDFRVDLSSTELRAKGQTLN